MGVIEGEGYYERASDTTPAPTVRPPSRMANFRPCCRGMGVMSSKSALTLSPGRHMCVSSGSLMLPVTSAVLQHSNSTCNTTQINGCK